MKNKQLPKQLLAIVITIVTLLSGIGTYETQATELPQIDAEAAILIDAKTGKILYEKNAHDIHYPASVTKIMTALLAIENLSPTDVITFSEEAIMSIGWNTSRIGIDVGEQLTVDQALHGLMLMSGNEVANGIAEHISGSNEAFAALMTSRAKEIGAHNTNFMNPHGLNDENHYTTAYDMALITREIYDNPYFQEIMGHRTYVIPGTNKTSEERPLAQNHRMMMQSEYYYPDVVGGKTGYTDIARHTLSTIASRGEIDLIAVVLRGSSGTIYTDTATLLDFGFDNYKTIDLHTSNDIVASLPMYSIKSGNLFEAGTVQVSVPENQSILVHADVKPRELIVDIQLPDYLEAGIEEGDRIGTITYTLHGEVLTSSDLIVNRIQSATSPYPVNSPNPDENLASFNLITNIGPFVLIAILIVGLWILKIRKRRKKSRLKFSKSLR